MKAFKELPHLADFRAALPERPRDFASRGPNILAGEGTGISQERVVCCHSDRAARDAFCASDKGLPQELGHPKRRLRALQSHARGRLYFLFLHQAATTGRMMAYLV